MTVASLSPGLCDFSGKCGTSSVLYGRDSWQDRDTEAGAGKGKDCGGIGHSGSGTCTGRSRGYSMDGVKMRDGDQRIPL